MPVDDAFIRDVSEFASKFIRKIELAEALGLFDAEAREGLADIVEDEIRADASLLAEALNSWLGWRVEGRKS